MDYSAARNRLDVFFSTGKEVTYGKRALIIGYFDRPEYAYWITSGSVKVISCNSEGVERIQHIYEKGELFPVKWLFDRSQFEVAFFALTDVTVRVKPIIDFMAFIEEEPATLVAIIHQQMALIERLVNLHIEAADERVVFGLLSLASRLEATTHNKSNDTVHLPLTIQDLASTIRLSRETTGKVLRALHDRGLVAIDRQTITVHPKKLQQLLNA